MPCNFLILIHYYRLTRIGDEIPADGEGPRMVRFQRVILKVIHRFDSKPGAGATQAEPARELLPPGQITTA